MSFEHSIHMAVIGSYKLKMIRKSGICCNLKAPRSDLPKHPVNTACTDSIEEGEG